MIEQILTDLALVRSVKSVCLRYFNAAGADKDCEIGEDHEPEPHLIPLAIQAASGGSPLKIFGSDFSTPDGTAVRDYIHVEDLARAHLLALEYLLKDGLSTSINLGTGLGTSVKSIVSSLQQLGLMVNYEYAPRRFGDPAYLVANPQKAKLLLGWEARYLDIKDILWTALLWHQKNGK
jgi:UDP-glucose 4-epimerase